MKQTLSVADFATILQLLDEEILNMENMWRYKYCVKDGQIIEWRLKELQRNPRYQSLLHLKESLQNLNIDVETPSVEVENKGE